MASAGCPQDPSDLDQTGRQCSRAGAGRPGAVAFAGARLAKLKRVLRDGDVERAFKPECDATPGGQVLGNGLHQLDDLRAARMTLDRGLVRIGPSPPEATVRDRTDVGAVDHEIHEWSLRSFASARLDAWHATSAVVSGTIWAYDR
jgi:hypothetical protein